MKKTLLALFIISLIVSTTTGCRRLAHWHATFENDIRQEYVIQDVNNRLYNYQWFYDQYQQCKAIANNAKLLTGDERTGTIMVLNSMISEYNSKSSQVMNSALFKADDLPYRLDIADFGL